MHNQESQVANTTWVDRARELGFHDVTVIDDDLGRSGSVPPQLEVEGAFCR
jgi:hypothetical protein